MPAQIKFYNDTTEMAYLTCTYIISGLPQPSVVKDAIPSMGYAQRSSQGTVYIRWSHRGDLPDPAGDSSEQYVCAVPEREIDLDFKLSEHPECQWL